MLTIDSSAGTGSRSALERLATILLLLLGVSFISRLINLAALPYVGFALAGVPIAQVAYRSRWRELVLSVAAGAAVFGGYAGTGGRFLEYAGAYAGILGSFAGCGGIIVLLYRRLVEAPAGVQLRRLLWIAGTIPLLTLISGLGASFAVHWRPLTWDHVLYAVDRKMGVDVFLIGQWLHRRGTLFRVCEYVYNALPLSVAVYAIVWSIRFPERRFDLLRKAVLLGALGFICYQIVPACGPSYRYGARFPWQPPAVSGLPLTPQPLPEFLRNALPSLHFGWILLCFWNSRAMGRLAHWAAAFLVSATALATVGFGEHYLMDLVVAFPVCAMAHALNADRNWKRWIMALGAVLALLWMVGLRSPEALLPLPAAALQSAALFTVVVSAALSFLVNHQQTRRLQVVSTAVELVKG